MIGLWFYEVLHVTAHHTKFLDSELCWVHVHSCNNSDAVQMPWNPAAKVHTHPSVASSGAFLACTTRFVLNASDKHCRSLATRLRSVHFLVQMQHSSTTSAQSPTLNFWCLSCASPLALAWDNTVCALAVVLQPQKNSVCNRSRGMVDKIAKKWAFTSLVVLRAQLAIFNCFGVLLCWKECWCPVWYISKALGLGSGSLQIVYNKSVSNFVDGWQVCRRLGYSVHSADLYIHANSYTVMFNFDLSIFSAQYWQEHVSY